MINCSKAYYDARPSWFVCASSFVVQFVIFGIHSSVGIFFVAFGREFHRSESATAWVGSLAFGIMFFIGPLTTALCDHVGCRIVTCLGGLLSFIGLLSTSFVTNFTLLYFTYGLLWGVGTSFGYFASLVILPLHFRNYLSLAYGIAIAGAGLGVPPMTWAINQLIGHYDWRVTMRILAGITLLMCVVSVSYGPLTNSNDLRLQLKKRDKSRNMETSILLKLKLHFSMDFVSLNTWKNRAFIVWAVSLSFIAFGNLIPFVFLISIANDIGIPSSKSALLIGYQAITQTAARIAFGRLGSSSRINPVTAVQIVGLALAVNATLFPLASSYSSLVVYVVVFGLFDGCLAVSFGMGTLYIVGEKLVGRAFGNLCCAAAIGNVLGPPVAGFIFDVSGKYDIAFYLSGAIMTFGVCLLFLVSWLMPSKREKSGKENAMLLSEHDQLTKRAVICRRTSRPIFSYPTEASFLACNRQGGSPLQRSVSMEMLCQNDTPRLTKSAMYRAWSAASQLHCLDSLNESSGYESDCNRQSSSLRSSGTMKEPIKLGSVTIVTPALSFDDLEVAVEKEQLVKEGWFAGSIDLFSVLCEGLLENDASSSPTSVTDTSFHGNDLGADTNARTTSVEIIISRAILSKLEFSRETNV